MADDAERAQEYQQIANDNALEAFRAANATVQCGRDECECGEPISAYRRSLGATLCMACKEDEELRARLRR